jgi:uncharacterized membrane protein|tara:strand:+ start:98 stop:385 length:288 start_codon:yes stop_codon:yes gene_type:complete
MNLDFLKNPFISGIISASVVVILFLIDSKIVKKKKEKKDYIKIFIFVLLSVSVLIYIMNIHGLFTNNKILEKVETSIELPVKEIKRALDTGIADF